MNHHQPHTSKAATAGSSPALAKRRESHGGIPDYVVQLPARGGRGVLAGSGIISAAHCIAVGTQADMVLSTLGVVWTVCGPSRALSAKQKQKKETTR